MQTTFRSSIFWFAKIKRGMYLGLGLFAVDMISTRRTHRLGAGAALLIPAARSSRHSLATRADTKRTCHRDNLPDVATAAPSHSARRCGRLAGHDLSDPHGGGQ